LLTRPLRYRGIGRLAYLLGTRVFNPGNNVVVTLGGIGRLRVFLRDGYWIRLLFSDFTFEPEVEIVLATVLARPDVHFIDCGANIGYWSVVASKLIGTPERVLAIEASPRTFERLVDNAALNGDGFRCLSAAVWSQDNMTLEIVSHDERHAGSSVVNRRRKRHEPGYRTDKIGSVTLDAVCERFVDDGVQVVVKLDVEGAEIAALQGAEKLLMERRPLLVYEDHGNDPSSRVSEFALDVLGMQVYYCTERGSIVPMRDLEAVQGVKRRASAGYNFFACAPDSVFASCLAGLAAAKR
jgi:FkbM family methyltransferase